MPFPKGPKPVKRSSKVYAFNANESEIEYRVMPATPEDIEVIYELLGMLAASQKYEFKTKKEFLLSCFGILFHALLIFRKDQERAIGFVNYNYSFATFSGTKKLIIQSIFVRPEFQRLGAGMTLMEHLNGLAIAGSCTKIEYKVLKYNSVAREFFSKYGAVEERDWMLCSFQL